MKFSDQLSGYFEVNRSAWKASTFSTYKDLAHEYLLPIFGDLELAGITKRSIELLREDLKKRISGSRINMTLCLLSRVMQDAFANKLIADNPCVDVKRAKAKTKEKHPLNRDEIDQVISFLEPHYKPFFITMSSTGARPSELLALRWSNIDLENGSINIQFGRVAGIEDTPKTKSAVRLLQLSPSAKASIASRPRTCDYVFTRREGDAPINNRDISRAWTRACQRSGVRHERAYLLRHSFGSWLLDEGLPVTFVSKTLGHASVDITMKLYVRDTGNPEHDRQLQEILTKAV